MKKIESKSESSASKDFASILFLLFFYHSRERKPLDSSMGMNFASLSSRGSEAKPLILAIQSNFAIIKVIRIGFGLEVENTTSATDCGSLKLN